MRKSMSILTAVALSIPLVVGTGTAANAAAGAPFACTPNFYQVTATGSGAFYQYSPTTNTFGRVGSSAISGINAIGYNPLDNYIYGIASSKLIQIDSAGGMTDLGSITGSPASSGGDFWGASGNMLTAPSNSNSWTKLNIATRTATAYTLTTASGSTAWGALDLTIIGDTAYGLSNQKLYTVALGATSGVVSTKTVSGPTNGSYGASYADSSGNMYFFNNNTSEVFKITAAELAKANPVATKVTTASPTLSAPNDGAACSLAASPFDPPTPVNDIFNVNNSAALTINGSSATNIKTNDQAGIAYKVKSVTYNGTTITANTGSVTSSNGTLNITDLANGYFTFTPVEGFTGAVSFTYDLVETAGTLRTSDTSGTVTINMLGVTSSSMLDGTVGSAYSLSLTAAGGSTGTYTWELTSGTLPAGLTLNSDGTITGTPTETVTNTPLTFRVTNNGVTSVKTLNLTVGSGTVTPPPTVAAPTVGDITQTTNYNTPVIATPATTNDAPIVAKYLIDPADDSHVATVTIPNQGTYALNEDGTVTFTPLNTFTGAATPVSYVIEDNIGQTGTGVISTTVNAPEAATVGDITDATLFNTEKTVTPATSNEAPITEYYLIDPATSEHVSMLTITGEGTYIVNEDGSVTFTPDSSFAGETTTVTYGITDAVGNSDTSSINITVGLPTAPTLDAIEETTTYNTVKTIIPSYTGVNVQEAEICFISGETCVKELTNSDGTYTFDGDNNVVFTPLAGKYGATVEITLHINDAYGQTATNTINITVGNPVGLTMTNLSDVTTGYNTPAEAVFTPTKGSSETVNFCIISGTECVTTLTVNGEGLYTIDQSGKLTFTPEATFTGMSTLMTVRATDGLNFTAEGTVKFDVTAPATPTASPYSQNVAFNDSATFTPDVSSSVAFDNFCLIDGSDCVATLNVNGGTFSINSETGEIYFQAEIGFTGNVAQVSYRATNIVGQNAENNVNITVDSEVIPPAPEYATISGVIWLDLNHNNVKDANEPLLPNVPVTLTNNNVTPTVFAAALDMNLLTTVTPASATYTVYTDANGQYDFSVQVGSYTLNAQITSNRLDPSWDSTGNTDWSIPVVVAANEAAVADFAAAGSGAMSGTVVFDNNEIIPNAQVMCIWEGMDGILPSDDDVKFYFTSDANGNFTIEGIPGGQFNCEGKDPNSMKTSAVLSVAVDQNSGTPAEAELVVATETVNVPSEAAASNQEPLVHTGSNMQDPLALSTILIAAGAFMVGLRRRVRKH